MSLPPLPEHALRAGQGCLCEVCLATTLRENPRNDAAADAHALDRQSSAD
jgi:hypothetical protein